MEAGKLNKRVTFRRPTIVIGEGVTGYTDAFTVWTQIRPLVGNRRYQAQQLNSEAKGQMTIRYRTDVKPDMQLYFDGRIFYIISIINPEEKCETLEIEYGEKLD